MAVDVRRDGPVAIVTLSRPEALNAFNTSQLETLLEAARSLSSDQSVRAVVLTGEGDRAFAAGADISEMSTKTPSEAYEFARLGQVISTVMADAPQPWIAAVNGFALGGGCEIALACDIRLASQSALFGQPEVTLGVPAGWGATQRLPRLVGPAVAAELLLTGRRIKAEEALRLGVVSAVVPADELMNRALELARSIAANSPSAVAATKRSLRRAFDLSLDDGLQYEAQTFALTFGSHDQVEGMRAFAEKRKAEFTGE